jgi:hypothetical protein
MFLKISRWNFNAFYTNGYQNDMPGPYRFQTLRIESVWPAVMYRLAQSIRNVQSSYTGFCSPEKTEVFYTWRAEWQHRWSAALNSDVTLSLSGSKSALLPNEYERTFTVMKRAKHADINWNCNIRSITRYKVLTRADHLSFRCQAHNTPRRPTDSGKSTHQPFKEQR